MLDFTDSLWGDSLDMIENTFDLCNIESFYIPCYNNSDSQSRVPVVARRYFEGSTNLKKIHPHIGMYVFIHSYNN